MYLRTWHEFYSTLHLDRFLVVKWFRDCATELFGNYEVAGRILSGDIERNFLIGYLTTASFCK